VIVALTAELPEASSLTSRGLGARFEEGAATAKVARARDARNFMAAAVCLSVCCLGGSSDGLRDAVSQLEVCRGILGFLYLDETIE
jgi:hypothetical protein